MGTIADTIRSAISAGKTNEEVLAAAKLTKGKVAILKDGKIYTIKAPNGAVTPQFLELVAKKNAGARVLNGAPAAELVALLKSMTNRSHHSSATAQMLGPLHPQPAIMEPTTKRSALV